MPRMLEWSRYFFLAGSFPFIVLGILHAFATPLTTAETKGLSPRDATLREAMARETFFLTRRTTLWRAWVGFNFSHSIGAVVFGVVVVLIGESQSSFHELAARFLPFAALVGAVYLVVAFRYWFRTPIAGLLFAELCFVASWILFFLRA